MAKCSFCEHFEYRKKHEIKGYDYKYETAMIIRFGGSRSTQYFKKLLYCPECGKKLEFGEEINHER